MLADDLMLSQVEIPVWKIIAVVAEEMANNIDISVDDDVSEKLK